MVERELTPTDHPQTSDLHTCTHTRVNIVEMIIKRKEIQHGGRKIIVRTSSLRQEEETF